jgi:pSer/pThr/pTyr-binding forkhead associated (FHA) protein
MSLQVRLRHAMGERVYDIAARGADQPLIIGRGAEAGLQVPSMTVAPRHCVLFVTDGQWIVQEWTAGGTRLNGTLLEKPTPLRVGDVLSIGMESNAATLEIEPGAAAAGRKGTLARESAAAVAVAPPKQVVASPPPRRSADPPALQQPDWFAVDQAAPVATSATKSARRKQRSPMAAIIVTVFITLAIAAGTAWFVRGHLHPPVEVVVLPPAPMQAAVAPANIPAAPAVVDDSQSKPEPQPQPATAQANAAEVPEEVDPHADDPDWIDLQVAHDLPNQAVALLKYDDYIRRHPGKNQALLKQYQDEAMDRLWWQRIVQLCHRINRLTGEVAAKSKEIDEEGTGNYLAQLRDQKAALDIDLKSATDTLHTEMGYAADDPPDLTDETSLKSARAARDPAKFAAWSADLAQYARSHAGQTPWGDEDQ